MSRFVIGIGSQRAGSTLLYRILSEATPIFMHPQKELHYYDTLFGVRHKNVLKKYAGAQLERLGEIDEKKLGKRQHCFYRTNRILKERDLRNVEYVDLYRPCIMGHEFLGEITPEYMILPEEGIEKMRDDIGDDAKIILIARNPVNRFISAVKLLKVYSGNQEALEDFEATVNEVIDTMPGWVEHQRELSDYRLALERYRKYFRDVHFFCYDDIVRDPEDLRRSLEDFLGMEIDRRKFEKILSGRVNDLGKTGEISEDLQRRLEELFLHEGSFLEKCFGEDSCRL